MNLVCQDLQDLQDKWENRRDHLRLRFREETRETQVLQVSVVTLAFKDPLDPQVVRKEKRENQENQANEEKMAKMVTLVLQASLESKESQAFPVLQAGMEREDLRVNLDSRAHQEWLLAVQQVVGLVLKVNLDTLDLLGSKENEDQ